MAKVLVVDDDVDVRESLSDLLAREHEVIQAAGVPEALQLVRDQSPDVVVVDFELPPHRGDELLLAISKSHPRMGRFMLTGSPGRALGASYALAHRVLRKGCDLDELCRAIREYLGGRRKTG
jgi:two-component system, response regulator, stage 0 sporulation protein F